MIQNYDFYSKMFEWGSEIISSSSMSDIKKGKLKSEKFLIWSFQRDLIEC